MKTTKLKPLILSAFFLALGFLLPYITGQIPQIGAMLCPMHIPVLLCGFLCGWQWGMAVGAVTPILRSLLVGMPPLYPKAFSMMFELAVYGLTAGLFYRLFPKKKVFDVLALILSMLSGRIAWGIVMAVLMNIQKTPFGFSAFLAGAVTNSVPGIFIQLLLIPPILFIYRKVQNTEQ